MKKYLRLISALVVMFTFLLNNTINALATTATTQNVSALQGSTTPKEEFRGAWVSTAYNIDWQSSSGTSTDSQKQHYINLLNDINLEGITVIMATHDIEILKLFPKRVVEIQKGKIVKDTKRDLYEVSV